MCQPYQTGFEPRLKNGSVAGKPRNVPLWETLLAPRKLWNTKVKEEAANSGHQLQQLFVFLTHCFYCMLMFVMVAENIGHDNNVGMNDAAT